MSIKASCVCADNADSLILVADCNAAAAEDAFLVISVHMRSGSVDIVVALYTGKGIFILNAVVMAELLKLAGA